MSEERLERELGFLDATAIGLGTTIGGGIFILPSIAAAQAGPASIVSFVLAGVVSLLSALSHAEVATDMQDTEGGRDEYVTRALGPLLGSVVGWGTWVGLVFATAFYAVGFARYLTFFEADLPIGLVAAGLAVLLVGLNYLGAAEASGLEVAIVVALLLLVGAFVVGASLPSRGTTSGRSTRRAGPPCSRRRAPSTCRSSGSRSSPRRPPRSRRRRATSRCRC